MLACAPVEIRTKHLPDTAYKCYFLKQIVIHYHYLIWGPMQKLKRVCSALAHWLVSATLSLSGKRPSATPLWTSRSVFQFHISVISNWPTWMILLDSDVWTCTESPLYCCHQLVWITAAWDIHCLGSGILRCCKMEVLCQIKHQLSVVTQK